MSCLIAVRARLSLARVIIIVGGAAAILGCWFSPGGASVNIPLLLGKPGSNTPYNAVYEDIDRLVALGVIEDAMVVQKPYSRKQAAKYVARAIERLRDGRLPPEGQEAVIEPLLNRLADILRPELINLGIFQDPSKRPPPLLRFGATAEGEADAFSVGHGTVRFRENRGGEYYANGLQVQSSVFGWMEVGDVLAFSAEPKYISNQHVLGIGATNHADSLYWREYNAKLTLANVTFQAGRTSLWWGPGYHGSLLMTDNHFPLDMLQLGSEEPFRLPGFLRGLGQWRINSFLTQLDKDRDFSHTKVFGLRISYQPTSNVEIGLTRLTQFDGSGHVPSQSFPRTVFEAYGTSSNATGEKEVNEEAMVDLRWRIPYVPYLIPFQSGVQLYGELAGEDNWIKRSQFRVTPRGAAYLVGLYIPQVTQGSTMDFRVEYADTAIAAHTEGSFSPGIWYNNSTFPSGMRYNGFPLGHSMGTDARDFFIRTTRYVSDDIQVGMNFNYQQRAVYQPVHETKKEFATDVTWWLNTRTQFIVGYVFQRIDNPGMITSLNPFTETFTPGTSNNHFLWTSVTVRF